MEEVIVQTGRISRQGEQCMIIIQIPNIAKVAPFLNQKVNQEIRLKHAGHSVVIEQKGLISQHSGEDGSSRTQIFIQKKNLSKIAKFLGDEDVDEEIILSTIVPTVTA